MLSSKYRFHSRGGVNYTYKHGRSLRASPLSLVYAINSRRKQRFAVVVSKKVIKSAVGRNRIRRRVYEAIRSQLPELKTPTDCIFIVHSREVATMKFSTLTSQVKDLLDKAKLL